MVKLKPLLITTLIGLGTFVLYWVVTVGGTMIILGTNRVNMPVGFTLLLFSNVVVSYVVCVSYIKFSGLSKTRSGRD